MSFSLSPQFNQRWASTSQLIRQAIATELSDIIRLLQPETDLANFEFTHPNLTAYINELELKDASHQQYIRAESSTHQQSTPHLKTHHSQPHPKKYDTPTLTDNKHSLKLDKQHLTRLNKQQRQQLIKRLEQQIDDRVADSMIKVSEDIKSWLNEELSAMLQATK